MTNQINYIGPFNRTGYGFASMGYLKILNELCKAEGYKISYTPIGSIDKNDPEINNSYNQALLRETTKNEIDPSGITFGMWHLSNLPAIFPGSIVSSKINKKKIGITTFELNSLSDQEKASLRQIDSLIVASSHNQNVVNASLDDNVYTDCIDTLSYHSKIPHLPVIDYYPDFSIKQTDDKLSFWNNFISPHILPKDVHIFSTIGKFENRKGYNELFSAMNYVKQPILLVAFWYNPFMPTRFPYSKLISENYQQQYTNNGIKVYTKDNITIILMPPTATRQELYSYVANTHTYVNVSKGEGFNLPLYDVYSIINKFSLSMNVISTLNSAHKDYVDPSESIVIRSDNDEVAKDNMFFNGTSTWSRVDVSAIFDAMQVAINKTKASPNYSPSYSYFYGKPSGNPYLYDRVKDFRTFIKSVVKAT